MICSWLDHKSGLGSFFIDQALMLSNDYNFILISFRPVRLKFKNVKKLYKIEKYTYQGQLTLLYINYPVFKIFKKEVFKFFFKNKTLTIVNDYFNKNQIDIHLIHAQSIFNASFWASTFGSFLKVPYLITEHNQFTLRDCSDSEIKTLEKILNESSANLVVSNDLIRQFASNGFFQEFINVGNSVNEQFFNSKNREEVNSFEILTIGAYTPVKDQLTLLKALKIIDDKDIKGLQFTWIGINSWGANFEREVDDLITSFKFKNLKVKIVNKASKTEIVSALQKSNVFVFTSLCETFGLSALEALAVGVPVITTQSGGINEFMNTKNGVVVPIKDAESIAQNILKMINGELSFDSQWISDEAVNNYGSQAFTSKMRSLYENATIQK